VTTFIIQSQPLLF